jgi:hypothetical protein
MSSGRYSNPIDDFFKQMGLDDHCRPKAGGAGGAGQIPMIIHFVFYVALGGKNYLVVPNGSSPIIFHQTVHESRNDAAFECLKANNLGSTGAKKPSNLTSANGVFGHMSIIFVELNESDLVSSSSFLSLCILLSRICHFGLFAILL